MQFVSLINYPSYGYYEQVARVLIFMCTEQGETGKTKTSSNVVVVPVQQEKAASKAIPSQKTSTQSLKSDQKSSGDDLPDRLEKQERLFQTEKSNLEELHRSKVQSLEEQVYRMITRWSYIR